MTSSSLKSRPLQFLSSMCDEYSALRTRFAVLSIKGNRLSVFQNTVLLFLEYIQLLSPILLSTLFFAHSDESTLINIIIYAAKFLNPAYWLLPEQLNTFHTVVLCVSFGLLTSKQTLMCYIVRVAYYKIQANDLLLKTWRFIFKLQGRIVFGFVSCIWVNATIVSKDDDTSEFWHRGIKIMTLLQLGGEFVMGFRFFSKYEDILPSKDFLSSKNKNVELITLAQKLFFSLLSIFLPQNFLSSQWVFASLNLAFDAVRNLYFFKKLPLFSFRALYYQRTILMLVSSLNLAVFMGCLVYSIDDTTKCLPMVMALWIVLFGFMFKVSGAYLQRRFISLVFDTNIKTPHLLIHKLVAIKQLRKRAKNCSEHGDKNSWEFLLLKTVNANIGKVFEVESSAVDINSKIEVNILFRTYLEKLMQKYPKDYFIKLFAAQFYMKKFHIYGDSIKIARTLILKNKSSEMIKLNAELLLLDIQKAMKVKFSSKENSLNLWQYIFEQSLLAQTKELMIQQANLQVKICTEIKKESPDLGLILQISGQLESHRKKTNGQLREMLENTSEYHLEPLALCAQYQLTLNHSINEYIQFCKELSFKSLKYKDSFENTKLLQNNIFNENIAFYMISGNDADSGKILYASKGARKLSGRDPQSMIGTDFVVYFPPSLQSLFSTFYTSYGEKNHTEAFGLVSRTFHMHSKNYLTEAEFYFQIHPFVTQGFCFCLILKPVISHQDHMYVKENGDIDSSTKGIGELMDILPSSTKKRTFNIKELSEELETANEAINMILRPSKEKNLTMTIDEAKEIHSLYTTTGKDIQITKPGSSSDQTYSYNCKVAVSPYGSTALLKLFTFEKNKSRDLNQSPKPPIVQPKLTQEEIKISISEEGEADETEEFEYSAEKGNGWVDIQAEFTSRDFYTHRTSARLITKPEGENIMSTICPPDTMRNIAPVGSKIISIPMFSQSTGAQNVAKFEQKDKSMGGTGKFGRGAKTSLKTSSWSQFTDKKRIFVLYKTSLDFCYIPKFFRFLSPVFYLVFFGCLLGEFLLKASIDQDIANILLKKDLLRNSEKRDASLISTQGIVRLFWEFNEGHIDPSALGPFGPYIIPYYGYYLNDGLVTLGQLNKNLLTDTAELNQELRDFAFENDVRIYDNYFGETPVVYQELNNFQAIDRIIETGLTIVELSTLYGDVRANSTANFLFRNMVNDVFVKNTKISKMILSSLNDEYDHSHVKISLYLILLLLGFGAFMLVLLVILWRQYYKEVNNLSALCRLDQNKLTIVLHSFISFKDQLEDSCNFDIFDIEGYLHRFSVIKNEVGKREGSKNIQVSGLKKRYSIYVIKVSLFVLAMFGIFIGNYLFTRSSISSFKIQQSQIYTSDHYQVRINLAFISARELYFTNNTAKLENIEAKEELTKTLDEILVFKKSILETLTSLQESALTTQITELALDDVCPFLAVDMAVYCSTLKSKGQKTGLVYMLDGMNFILQNQLEAFDSSNRTSSSLLELQSSNLEMLAALYAVIQYGNFAFSSLNNQSFENRAQTVFHSTFIGLIISVILIVIVGILVWRCLLRDLRGGVGKFKNVLKVLPPELVLSNFILKNFLVKTSKGLLEAIKHDL